MQASSLPNIKLRHGNLAAFFGTFQADIVCLQVCLHVKSAQIMDRSSLAALDTETSLHPCLLSQPLLSVVWFKKRQLVHRIQL